MEATEVGPLHLHEHDHHDLHLISPFAAVFACAAMAFLYVSLLYLPSLVLRLPPPPSLHHHILRRFAGAITASFLCVLFSQRLLSHVSIKVESNMDMVSWLDTFGIRSHHLWQAIVYPIILTSLLYLGPLTARVLEMYEEWHQGTNATNCGYTLKEAAWRFLDNSRLVFVDILVWRNYILAPLTEEIVFRACTIPLLLCAGVRSMTIIFFCPLFFGLAHVNHFWELVHIQNYDRTRALIIVGFQFCYTTIFGWYTSYLYLRTGNILAPLSAHVFCNIMGLPDLRSVVQKKELIFLLVTGIVSFFFMLSPLSDPSIYNHLSGRCNYWLGYCRWN